MNEQFNTRIYHYMVPVTAENGLIIGYNDVLIKNAKEYLDLLRVAESNRQIYQKELAERRAEQQRLEQEKMRQAELEAAEKRRLKADHDYRRRYSFTKFLIVYNALKLLALEGKSETDSAELDRLLEAVNGGELIEEVVKRSTEFSKLYNRLEEII